MINIIHNFLLREKATNGTPSISMNQSSLWEDIGDRLGNQALITMNVINTGEGITLQRSLLEDNGERLGNQVSITMME
jgi:hypothetical protein